MGGIRELISMVLIVLFNLIDVMISLGASIWNHEFLFMLLLSSSYELIHLFQFDFGDFFSI